MRFLLTLSLLTLSLPAISAYKMPSSMKLYVTILQNQMKNEIKYQRRQKQCLRDIREDLESFRDNLWECKQAQRSIKRNKRRRPLANALLPYIEFLRNKVENPHLPLWKSIEKRIKDYPYYRRLVHSSRSILDRNHCLDSSRRLVNFKEFNKTTKKKIPKRTIQLCQKEYKDWIRYRKYRRAIDKSVLGLLKDQYQTTFSLARTLPVMHRTVYLRDLLSRKRGSCQFSQYFTKAGKILDGGELVKACPSSFGQGFCRFHICYRKKLRANKMVCFKNLTSRVSLDPTFQKRPFYQAKGTSMVVLELGKNSRKVIEQSILANLNQTKYQFANRCEFQGVRINENGESNYLTKNRCIQAMGVVCGGLKRAANIRRNSRSFRKNILGMQSSTKRLQQCLNHFPNFASNIFVGRRLSFPALPNSNKSGKNVTRCHTRKFGTWLAQKIGSPKYVETCSFAKSFCDKHKCFRKRIRPDKILCFKTSSNSRLGPTTWSNFSSVTLFTLKGKYSGRIEKLTRNKLRRVTYTFQNKCKITEISGHDGTHSLDLSVDNCIGRLQASCQNFKDSVRKKRDSSFYRENIGDIHENFEETQKCLNHIPNLTAQMFQAPLRPIGGGNNSRQGQRGNQL